MGNLSLISIFYILSTLTELLVYYAQFLRSKHRFIIIIIVVVILIIVIIIELTHNKTILENTVEIEPQPVALDFKNLSQYSSRPK